MLEKLSIPADVMAHIEEDIKAAAASLIGEEKVLDLIADQTDGGKASIKKRVKKYNLKKFN